MTSLTLRARTRLAGQAWSDWADAAHVQQLPPGQEAQVEAILHTDDGRFTPRLAHMGLRDGGENWSAGPLPTP